MGCTFNCLATYACQQPTVPLAGATFGPYVKMTLGTVAGTITVGNASSPPGNHAVITSMEYGMTDGQGCVVEVIDEEGGAFSNAINALNKSLATNPKDEEMIVEFGWILNSCGGAPPSIQKTQRPLIFTPTVLKTNYEGGKIKFTITGTDMMGFIAQTRVQTNQGYEGQLKTLKQAIKDLMATNNPKIQTVSYLTPGNGTKEWIFGNDDGGPDGPSSVWTCDQQNALATIRKWITPLSTKAGNGITLAYDCTTPGGELILWEGLDTSGRNNTSGSCTHNLGTYLVNGGKCSNVISFSPQAEYTYAMDSKTGGTSGGPTSGASVKSTGDPDDPANAKKQGGITSTTPPQNTDVIWRAQDDVVPKAQAAEAAHSQAVRYLEHRANVECELKVMGDPNLVLPKLITGATVSIVVINPFYISPNGGGACGNWLAKPQCNSAWSFKSWQVKSVNHQIKAGSFVTTLKVLLQDPVALAIGT